MRIRPAIGAIIFCTVCQGCSVVNEGLCNLAYETARCQDRMVERFHYRKWANEAWEAVRQANPVQEFSKDHVLGFKEGFVDFVGEGGTGEPPLFPPSRYLKSRYQNAEGFQAIQDWFIGFRQGAAAAQEGGYRRFRIVPWSPPGQGPMPPLPSGPPAAGLTLPLPRRVEPITGPATTPLNTDVEVLRLEPEGREPAPWEDPSLRLGDAVIRIPRS